MYTKDDLQLRLKKDMMKISFLKKDGSVRDMLCTLMTDHLPEMKPTTMTITDDGEILEKKKRKQSEDVISVWDMEKSDWRSIRLDSIQSVSVHSNKPQAKKR